MYAGLDVRERRSNSNLADMGEGEFLKGASLLFSAFEGDEEEVGRKIRDNPRLVTFKDYDRRTALHLAASEGHMGIVNLLLDADADISPSDRWGGSPMDDALRHRHKEVAKVLRERGARHGTIDSALGLISFAAKGDADEVKRLLSDGIDPNSKDYDSRTPLHLACGEGHTETVKVLLAAGADKSLKNNGDATALHYAKTDEIKALLR